MGQYAAARLYLHESVDIFFIQNISGIERINEKCLPMQSPENHVKILTAVSQRQSAQILPITG
jgi:hypothetical protein